MKRTIARYIKIVFLSICVSLAFTLNYQYVPEAEEYTNGMGELLLNLYQSMSYNMVLESILAALVAYLLVKMDSLHIERPLIIHIFACVLAICWVLHLSYSMCNSISLLYCTTGQIVKTIILLVGFTTVIDRFSCLLNKLCSENVKDGNAFNFFKEHCYFKIAIILTLIWLPYVLLTYPGNVYSDTNSQIAMAFGLGGIERTTHHSAVMTMILYSFISFGIDVFENPSIGLFLYEIAQVLYAILAFAYVIKVMIEEFHAPKWLVIFTFMLLTLSPYYSNSVTIIVKDVPYAVSYMLLSTELALFLKKAEILKMKFHMVVIAFSIFWIYSYRNNGVYALILIIICVAIILTRRHMLKYVAVFIAPMVLSALIVLSVVNFGEFSSGSKIEAMCIPIQQVGRIIKFFPEEVTEEQKEVLEKVCDYERMASAYTTLIADPVKDSFYKYASTEEYLDFLKVWLQLAAKHPITAVSATFAQNLPLISPFDINDGICVGAEPSSIRDQIVYGEAIKDIGIKNGWGILNYGNNLITWYRLLTQIPVLSLFCQQAIYIISLLIMTCFAIHSKNKKFLMATIPSYVGVLVIIAGPAIQYFPRYAYPIIYQIPMLISFFIYSKHRQEQTT